MLAEGDGLQVVASSRVISLPKPLQFIRVRQPIEFLFNWIEQKTGIQQASKVRSYRGLLVHIFGRLAAAFFILALFSS